MNDLTFNVLKLAISVCTILVTIYVIPYIKAKIAADKYSELIDTIERAVRAAEQTIGAGNGPVKKDEVMAFILEYVSKEGIKVTQDVIDQLIEAAVFSMNKGV